MKKNKRQNLQENSKPWGRKQLWQWKNWNMAQVISSGCGTLLSPMQQFRTSGATKCDGCALYVYCDIKELMLSDTNNSVLSFFALLLFRCYWIFCQQTLYHSIEQKILYNMIITLIWLVAAPGRSKGAIPKFFMFFG